MQFKSFMEALKGDQHKLDKNKNGKVDAHDFKLLRKEEESCDKEDDLEESIDRVERSDYKVNPSGKKSHKQIEFKNGEPEPAPQREEVELEERSMTDAEMKKREDYVKGMKKNLASFKDKYGDRAKDVMYATATKMAMKEETLEESMADSWKKVQSMDKGSVTGGKDEVKKRLAYLNAVHDHHKKFGNDTKKVKGEIESINRSRIAEDLEEQAPVAPSLMKHRISVTVSDPNHTMVSKRKEKIQKTVIVTHSDNKEGAQKVGEKFYKKKGYRVHDSHHAGMVKEDTDLEEGYIVKYHAADGAHKNSSKVFNDKTKAEKHAALGNSINKVGGKYTVHKIDSEGRSVKEETELQEDAYAKSEENKKSADSAKKQGDMFAHHLHMADHHDNMAEWHASKGRHGEADKHAEKAEQHQELAMKHKNVKEEVEQIDEIGDTTKGQKLLQKVNKRAVDRLISKRADTDPAYAKKAMATHKAADERLKEEAEQIDEISQKLAGNYYGAATKKHIEKVGVKPNMYGRIEKDMGKQRKAGVDRAMDRITGARKTNEETNQFDEEGNLMAEKLKFSDFIAKINEQLLEYESDSSGVYRHTKKATYGTSYQGDDDEDKPKKAAAPDAPKRGRGRPAGSTGASYKPRSAETKAAAAAKAAATKAANKNK